MRKLLRRDSGAAKPASSQTSRISGESKQALLCETITIDAVMDCVARAIHETRQRTRSYRSPPVVISSVSKPGDGGESDVTGPASKRARLCVSDNLLDSAHFQQETKTAPVERPRAKPREKAKKKPGKQTDKDKTKYGNDPFFSSEAGLVAESASSVDALRWLSHHALELKINDIVNWDLFKSAVYDMDKIGASESKEIEELASSNSNTRSPWRVAVLSRGLKAKQFIANRANFEKAHCRRAILHLVNIVKDVGVAILSSSPREDVDKFQSQLTVSSFMACIDSIEFISFADAVHVQRWLLLHWVLHKILHVWTRVVDTAPMLNPTVPLTDIDDLSKEFTEKSRKGRPKTAKAKATRPQNTSATGSSNDAKGGDATKQRLAKTAIFHLNQLMDRLWWVPFKLASGLMKMMKITSPLSDRYLLELSDIADKLLYQWDGVADAVTQYSLGATGAMSYVANVYRPASGANRSRAPIEYLFDKCSPSRSKVRMWKSQYGPHLRFDRRELEFVVMAFMCSMEGNYEHFDVGSHPGFAFRYLLNHTWFRMKMYAKDGIESSRFFEFLFMWQPTLLQHVVRQYMDWVCRNSEITRSLRKAMHSSESDLERLELEINSIVDKARSMFDRARLMVFNSDVLLRDLVPASLLSILKTIDTIIYPRSHAVMLKCNYGKSKLGFMTELRARFRTIPSQNAIMVMSLRKEVSKWMFDYALRYFGSTEYSEWPELYYNDAVVTHKTTTSIATEIASFLRSDYYDLDGKYVHADDTIAELTVTRAQFDVLQDLVLTQMDPYCPKPEHILRELLPEFGSCSAAIEMFDAMVFNHSRAQHIDGLCSKMMQYYPMTYSVIQTFAALWERRTSLTLRRISRQQLEAQLVATAHRPDLRFFIYCRACARIRTTVSECDRQRVSTRWASNARNINVKREGWTPSLRSLIEHYEEKKEVWDRARPRIMCNESSIFGDLACYVYGSAVKIPAVGRAIEYRNTLVNICCFPMCGTHATIDTKRCAFWQGGYVCSLCTIVLWVIARRLERTFGIVGGPWTIEVPFLETIKNNPSEIVLGRIIRKELEDEAYEEAQIKKHPNSVALEAKLARGNALTAEERQTLMAARKDATVLRQARLMNARGSRGVGRGRGKPK
jgi:hypothetical protein